MPAPPTDVAGVVLAAGLGTRLRPLTELLPKALCPVGNVPLLDLAAERLRAGGVTDLGVNVHHHRNAMVEHLAAQHPDAHVSIEEGEALGTAGALGALKRWIDGRAVIVHNADAWFDDTTAVERLLDGWDGERLRLLVLTPARPGLEDLGGAHTFAGVSLLPWHAVERLRPEPTGLWEVSWKQAWDDGRIELVGVEPGANWFDTGTPATYLAANLAANGGHTVVHPTATVDPTATVEHSVVWPHATVHAGEHLQRAIRAPGEVTVQTT